MSFVLVAPESVRGAAQDLAGLHDALVQATASAAAPTTGVLAAAEDEVSAGIAAAFGAFGEQYQSISVQAQAFHSQFVGLLNAGAGAYLGAEAANAAQNLLGAVDGSGGAVSAASLLGGTSVGQTLGGALTAVQNGSAVSMLSGQLGSGLLQTGAVTGLATVATPYQALFNHTVDNLQILGNTWQANPAPFLHQFLVNQAGYAHAIAADIEYVVQNFPAVLANLPTNIQAAVQALLAFNPAPYVQQLVANQIAYAQIWATSLQNAAHDFGIGLQQLPTALQSAFQALAAGDVNGAVGDLKQGFTNLFVTGVDVSTTGSLPGTLTADVRLTGALADLSPILAIPGMRAEYLTSLLPHGSIPAQISQNVTNVLDTVTDTSLTALVVAQVVYGPPPFYLPTGFDFSLANIAGLPTALALDAIGAPINAANALGASTTAFTDAVRAGNWSGAATALIDAPAVVTDAFLNGQSTLPIAFDVSGYPASINLPLDGILVPPTPYTASVATGIPLIGTVTTTVGGTPISGLATGLLVYGPEQLALAIGAG
ncbi:PE family protein [Mycobacterium sp. HUMS_1102779]|uniref:PE family protein n=1 Tax=Mycobacterium sp. HUMS_1102779 TaxID=3383487 RepID=UPI00389B19B0